MLFRYKFLIAISFLVLFIVDQQVFAEVDYVKMAFTRNHDLWIKVGDKEKQLTHGEFVTNPKWSYDAKWIVYARGKEENQMWLYDIENDKHIHPFLAEATNYQWAPNKDVLAFQSDGVLNMIDVRKLEKGFENIALGVGNYSWVPGGNGFLVSSMANLLPTGWTGVELFKVPIDAKMDSSKIKHFYTLPKQSNDFFAISTSTFKWSANQKWIAFLAIPTASWSMDSDSLCVISADGREFETVDKMIINENWFKWAPTKTTLAYIEGEGRFALENKHLKLKELPAFRQNVFTPKGYVDWDFTWHNDTLITISRAKESEWSNDPKKRPLPVLYQVNVQNNHQENITSPPKGYGDYNPYYLKRIRKLTWLRSDGEHTNMWIANADGSNARIWIKNIDSMIGYYEKRNWDEVLGIYE
ncbi:TolB family protein [Ectobacillus panaciterrae]|uniref:TolB family protein n=1 Tax=Ectobacillus panaciterrae TaxID=363872 RepID=UPI000426A308|nr:hypothetical protein [Ectobacillus panaciterrae]